MKTLLSLCTALLIFCLGCGASHQSSKAGDLLPPLAPEVSDKWPWSIQSNMILMGMNPTPAQFVSTLTCDELIKSPAWQPKDGNPPLSPRKAEDAAFAMVRKVVPGTSWFQPDDISLRAFELDQGQGASEHEDIRWVYLLSFRLEGRADYEGGSLDIIVLLDGTAIEPKRIDKKQLSPGSTNLPPGAALRPIPAAPQK